MSRIYGYSPRNKALIHRQFPGAQAVGSFKFWKDNGFSVKKGEKGIKIIVRNQTVPKFKDEKGKWKNIKHANETEKKKIKSGELEKVESKIYYSEGNVFDISQTNATAKDLPEIFPNRWLEGDVKDYHIMMNALRKIGKNIGFTIGEPLQELGVAKGACYYTEGTKGGHIGLNPRNSELQNFKTLSHELAHAKLHVSNYKELSRAEKEFQAELTAFSVASYFGIDTSDYSLGYLANWTKGKDLKDKAKLIEEVHETAMEFISAIEKEIIINKEVSKELTLETKHDKELILMEYGNFGKIDIKKLVKLDLEKMFMKNGALESISSFNVEHKERYTLIDPETVTEPTIVIKWSEASNKLKSNAILPFKEANEIMKEIIKEQVNEVGYYKTWYSVLLPNNNGDIDVLAMDRIDLGDGYYSSPYEQIIEEKNLSQEQYKALSNVLINERDLVLNR